jgi:hypothetical protein
MKVVVFPVLSSVVMLGVDKMLETLLQNIAEQGLLGLLLVLSFFVICYLYKENKEEREQRLVDTKELIKDDVLYKSEIRQLIQNILDLLRRSDVKKD